MIHLKITPDSRLDNQNVDELARALYMYRSPLERMNKGRVAPPHVLSFETVLAKGGTSFYVTVPESIEKMAVKAISSTWPRVSVETVAEPFARTPTVAATLSFERHYMFALRVDKRRTGALGSLLETLKNMDVADRVYVQTIATAASPHWYQGAVAAYDRFKKGAMPKKVRVNKKEIGGMAFRGIVQALYGTASMVTELIANEPLEPLVLNGSERAMILRDGGLSDPTIYKSQGNAYEVQIRVAVVCKDTYRAASLLRMVTTAFRELDGDNMLVAHNAKPAKLIERMKARKLSLSVNHDYMSISELSRFHLLPSGELQDVYDIPHIAHLERDVPAAFRKSGLYVAETELKKVMQRVYIPTNNYNVLCLPRIVIGGMGAGKTRGYMSNFVVQAVKNGFGAIAIDPARGEVFEEVSSALPPEQIIHIDLGKTLLSLDWREVYHGEKGKNRLKNTILGFFASADMQAGGQTARYIGAAVMAMRTGKLAEVLRIFEDAEYRAEAIELMDPKSIHRSTLQQYDKQSEARQAQILAPILNRLDMILGDEHLSDCMDTDEGLDMVELMSQKKAVVIDVKKEDLGPEAVDVIVNLLTTKIDIAMTLRKEQHPFFILLDEPHQFLRSAKTWKAAAVESRKYKVGYVWLFHSWEQIPKDLAQIVKDAGPSYTLYASSKKTFRDLAEEIAPYNVEDGIKLKKWHAINVFQSDEGLAAPFIAKMAPPPSDQKEQG